MKKKLIGLIVVALACVVQGELFSLTWNGSALKVHEARDSAYPLNVVWPGYSRPIHQSRVDAFVSFDMASAGQIAVDLPEGVPFSDVPPKRYLPDFQDRGPDQKFSWRPSRGLGLFDVVNYDLTRKRPDGSTYTIDYSKFNILYDRLTFRNFTVLGDDVPLRGNFRLTAGKEEIRDLRIEGLPDGVVYSKRATFTNPIGLK